MAAIRMTEGDLAKFQQNSGRGVAPAAEAEMARGVTARLRKNKYGAHSTVIDGKHFDSKLEAKRYQELVLLEGAGEVMWFLRQVPFALPGGVVWRADFVVVLPWTTGSADVNPLSANYPVVLRVEDCKGYDTQAGKNKIKQVEELYGIHVLLLRAARKTKARRK